MRHLEYFHDHVRIERMLFDGFVEPVQGSLRPDRSRPGLGVELREREAAPDFAKRQILRTVGQLSPLVRQGIPVVILEPSTAAVFRDELPDLFPQHQDWQRLTGLTYLLSEFLERERLVPPRFAAKAIFQSHCHEKAVLKADAAGKLLTEMGVEFHEPEKGCCGMAGSFGFERGK